MAEPEPAQSGRQSVDPASTARRVDIAAVEAKRPSDSGNRAGYPPVEGICPACKGNTLFLGAGGFVTCSLIACPNPCAPSEVLGAL